MVSLAAKIHASKHVFVIMSFAEDPKFEDLYRVVQGDLRRVSVQVHPD